MVVFSISLALSRGERARISYLSSNVYEIETTHARTRALGDAYYFYYNNNFRSLTDAAQIGRERETNY